jgi:hypothetical protein
MTEPNTSSGEQQASPRHGVKLYDVFMRVAFPVMLLVGTSATGLLWAHEGRITVQEVRSELETKSIKADLAEIKSDVKKLLEGPR